MNLLTDFYQQALCRGKGRHFDVRPLGTLSLPLLSGIRTLAKNEICCTE